VLREAKYISGTLASFCRLKRVVPMVAPSLNSDVPFKSLGFLAAAVIDFAFSVSPAPI
jgi:hypothetical protein